MRVFMAIMLLTAPLGGCSILSAKGDYADYRLVRLAEDDHARARAQAHYVSEHPSGAWAAGISESRTAAEDGIYQDNNATSAGLAFYLEIYPEGQYAEQGRLRLAALQQVEGRRETERESQREADREHRASAAEQRRTWASRAVGFWTQLLMGLEQWGQPIPDVARQNAEFNRAFGRAPRPRCSRDECIKFYRLQFGIPVPGRTRIDRELQILLRLRMRDGNLYRVEMLMPDRGFSRWYELENRTFVADMDPQSRQDAITFALGQLLPIIEGATSGAERIDIIPDPIEPPQVRDPSAAQPEPEAAPAETAPAEGASAEGASAEGASAEGAPEVGGEGGESAAEATAAEPVADAPAVEAPADEEPMAFIIPIALEARRAGDLQVVVFSASPDDEGQAYDGLYIEYLPAEEE